MRIAEHAAVSATVEACRQLDKPWATSLVNAVMRRFLRERTQIEERLVDDPSYRFAHPQLLQQDLKQAWPHEWTAICDANNQRPPLTLRVNSQRISRPEYQTMLENTQTDYTVNPHADTALTLVNPTPVAEIPGFLEGLVSIQDAAAQLSSVLVNPQSGDRVLDACAAPGGKTTHLLESRSDIDVIALDKDERRLQRVRENISRLGQTLADRVQVVCADAGKPELWWDGVVFQRILLDAPCTASGVIRRHPDIKHLRRTGDTEKFAEQQRKLLNSLWPLLAQGGRLVYTTCSVLVQENAERIEAFLGDHEDAGLSQIDATWGNDTGFGRQILPGENDMDGFFYACLSKAQ